MITKTALHPLARTYLRRLDRSLVAAPRPAASELREQIAAHLDDALGPDPSEAEVRTALDQLGTPESLAAEIVPAMPIARARWVDVLALILLSLGSFVTPVIGWLVGAALLASSPWFTGRQKALGLLVWPLGPVTPGLVALAEPDLLAALPGAAVVTLIVAVLAAPFAVAVWLVRRLPA